MGNAAIQEPILIDRRIEEKFLRELGPLLRAELENDLTEDIVLNADGRVWVKRRGGGFEHVGEMMDFHALLLIGTVAYMRGNLVVNEAKPILEVDLPIYKSRFEGGCSTRGHVAHLCNQRPPTHRSEPSGLCFLGHLVS